MSLLTYSPSPFIFKTLNLSHPMASGRHFTITNKSLTKQQPFSALAQNNAEATSALAALQGDHILEKELGEIHKLLQAMQEQHQKQLELTLAIAKTHTRSSRKRIPALACCVDAAGALVSPSYAFSSGESSLPSPVSFSGVPPAALTTTTIVDTSQWSPSRSSELYKVDGWGAPYFSVNSSGNISVRPHGGETLTHQEIDLLKIVKKVSDPKSVGGLGLQLPLIVRFPDVLKNRLQSLQSAFDFAVRSQGFAAHYQGVYPVKCNQDRFVVEDIVKFGSPFRFGLEAGSKPELLLAMNCLCKGNPESLLVCNGFKDGDYISLALLARKLALNTVIVLEEEDELDLVIDLSQKLAVSPVIGVRAKLRTRHSGHFGSTSGEKGKFGLNTTQILRVVKKLDQEGMLDCLQLLHFHIGSQIPSTALLADGVGEAAQIYCELVRLGANMQVIDIGGGLGIDYDGSKSGDSDLSVAYGVEEYALAVVKAVKFVCDRKNTKHPVICSESGRALVSHHSVLIFEAVSSRVPYESAASTMTPFGFQYFIDGLTEDAKVDYLQLTSAAYRGEHDACLLYADRLKQTCVDQFKEGKTGMEHLAAVDALCELFCRTVGVSGPVRSYLVNLSFFTSIPDFWGISQLFPIVPIHRLDERPGVRGTLSDLTCDSDGKIDKFINGESSLPLHEIGGAGGKYYLGMFLGGAYEEALGGVHNLYGGPSVVRVSQSDGPHGFTVTRAMPGPSCSDVLRVMQHEPELMFETLKHRAEVFWHRDEDSDDGMGNGGLADSLARCFQNMPYLATTCSFTAMNKCH